jgi:NADP-dependent 3-hydroxy acid dehydrogenase YdfG
MGKVLEAQDIADAIVYATSQPDHVAVNELLVRPAGQRT